MKRNIKKAVILFVFIIFITGNFTNAIVADEDDLEKIESFNENIEIESSYENLVQILVPVDVIEYLPDSDDGIYSVSLTATDDDGYNNSKEKTITVIEEVISWSVTLNFNEDSGKHDYVIFGEASDANDGPPADIYDSGKPPAPPDPPYFRVWFEDDLPGPYNWLLEDYRSYPDTEKTWDLYVEWKSNISNLTNITISWDISEFVNCEYSNITLMQYDPFDMGWEFATDMLLEDNYVYAPRYLAMNWLTDHFQIIAIENNPPNAPSNPNPINGATDVSVNADLSWTGGDPDTGDTVTYDIYFGTTNPPPIKENGYTGTTYDQGVMGYSTLYYWQIVAWDDHGASTSGSIWSFTTETASSSSPDPNPPDPSPDSSPSNQLPIADAGEPYTGYVDEEITFNGSLSYDPDGGDITSWYWNFGDKTNGTGEMTNHTYSNPGIYNVTLTVTDDENTIGSTETTATISQANRPPITPIINGTKTGNKNIEYTYTAVSTDPDNDTIRYLFDWDDDTNNTVSTFLASGITYNTSHNWTTSGVYTVRVYAKDENNALSGTTEMTVFIDMNVRFINDVIQGYLLDADNDGIYDIFHNNTTGNETTVELQDNGNYLIDNDGDTVWDYKYDPETSVLTSYSPLEKEEEDITFWYALVALIVVITISTIIFVYFIHHIKKKGKDKGQKKRRRQQKKAISNVGITDSGKSIKSKKKK